jgi:hypothetical protein
MNGYNNKFVVENGKIKTNIEAIRLNYFWLNVTALTNLPGRVSRMAKEVRSR